MALTLSQISKAPPFVYSLPKGVGVDPASVTERVTRLKVHGTDEVFNLPTLTCTKVSEVRALLEQSLGIGEGVLRFTHRQGCSVRKQADHEEIASNVIVHGIKSFRRQNQRYEHPHVIIGAGHCGLRLAMAFIMEGMDNFVLFERIDRVGGTSWIWQANSTSRLQTEVGVYHLQFNDGHDIPKDSQTNPWPTRGQLLEHFAEVSDRWGIPAYIKFNTLVNRMVVNGKDYWQHTYTLDLITTQGGNSGAGGCFTLGDIVEETSMECSSIAFFPGNLTNPKVILYPGEENLDIGKGDMEIVYGINNAFDYSHCKDQNCVIIGSGAFAVENVRTCVESHCKQITMVCRRKTLAMPRIVSWYINQSHEHIPAGKALDAMQPMYDLIGVDPWGYYAVYSDASRKNVNIRQASRFGIGDIYFLSMACGKTRHIVDDVKRVDGRVVFLKSGDRLEDTGVMLKLLGFTGEPENDKLLKIKEHHGFWANGDHRRFLVAEPIGVEANNFGGTSLSPGALAWSDMHQHFINHPQDWRLIQESNSLPINTAKTEPFERPAYVVDSRHGSMTMISVMSAVPLLAERVQSVGPWKRNKMLECNPIETFLPAAKKEWDAYCELLTREGYNNLPAYPYTRESVQELLDWEEDFYKKFCESQSQFTIDGFRRAKEAALRSAQGLDRSR